ncbi:hypothetical protein CDO52_10880 [Nocardiopsis gilva YIM 90087]|uniref:Secreted protein n=1 Tax=Nocardiopsis gilva YIM 90087 TaxID=1235441 RepID=A0A223S522_9ACTN|nr:hypothetical protein [Nocardiopsis gilva]ASU83211.1 hypothetical protein CDO52_10880 [Nocardiopsis gilva YIM 90087]
MRGVSTGAAIAITTGALLMTTAGAAGNASEKATAQGPTEDLVAVLAAVEDVCSVADELPDTDLRDVGAALPDERIPAASDVPGVPDRKAPGGHRPPAAGADVGQPDELMQVVEALCAKAEDIGLDTINVPVLGNFGSDQSR